MVQINKYKFIQLQLLLTSLLTFRQNAPAFFRYPWDEQFVIYTGCIRR